MNKRSQALLLAGLMMTSMTMQAAYPQRDLSFFGRVRTSITQFFNRMPAKVKWGLAFLSAAALFYLASDYKARARRYKDLVDAGQYGQTVLAPTGQDLAAEQINTGNRGLVTIEQLTVACQNLKEAGMCTCGQHAVTQAEIIANAVANNQLQATKALLRNRQFMGAAVQATCLEAKNLVQNDRIGVYRCINPTGDDGERRGPAIDPGAGWTDQSILTGLLAAKNMPAGHSVALGEHLLNQDIDLLNQQGIHNVILHFPNEAHWITVVIDRPAAYTAGHYYIADSLGNADRRTNPRIQEFILRLETAVQPGPIPGGPGPHNV